MSSILSTSLKAEVEKLLKKQGWRVLADEPQGGILLAEGEKERLVRLPADLLVAREGRIAPVLISAKKFDPVELDNSVRLLALDQVFGGQGVVVVDLIAREVKWFKPKTINERNWDFYRHFLLSLLVIGLVIAIIWLLVQLKLF